MKTTDVEHSIAAEISPASKQLESALLPSARFYRPLDADRFRANGWIDLASLQLLRSELPGAHQKQLTARTYR